MGVVTRWKLLFGTIYFLPKLLFLLSPSFCPLPSSACALISCNLFLSLSFFPHFSFPPSGGLCGPLWRPWPYEVTDRWVRKCCSEAAGPPLVPQWGLCTPVQKEEGLVWRIPPLQLGAVLRERGFSAGSLPGQITEQDFCADIRPMLEQQLYQLQLVRLIIYCWGNGN